VGVGVGAASLSLVPLSLGGVAVDAPRFRLTGGVTMVTGVAARWPGVACAAAAGVGARGVVGRDGGAANGAGGADDDVTGDTLIGPRLAWRTGGRGPTAGKGSTPRRQRNAPCQLHTSGVPGEA
jgi:hypothetical protein